MKHLKVTQKEFDKMKLLQKAGLKRKDIIAFTGRGGSTVERAMATNTLEEFTELQRKVHARYRTPKDKPVPVGPPTKKLDEMHKDTQVLSANVDQLVTLMNALVENKDKRRLFR